MAKQREAGDFDQAFAKRLSEHLVSGGAFDKAVVESYFYECARHLGASPSKRDAMDIKQLFTVIEPVVGEVRTLSKRAAAHRIFMLIFEH